MFECYTVCLYSIFLKYDCLWVTHALSQHVYLSSAKDLCWHKNSLKEVVLAQSRCTVKLHNMFTCQVRKNIVLTQLLDNLERLVLAQEQLKYVHITLVCVYRTMSQHIYVSRRKVLCWNKDNAKTFVLAQFVSWTSALIRYNDYTGTIQYPKCACVIVVYFEHVFDAADDIISQKSRASGAAVWLLMVVWPPP